MAAPIYKGGAPFQKVHTRFKNSVCAFIVPTTAAAPTNGTSGTGAGKAGPSSVAADALGNIYVNTGTKASPTWSLVQAAGGGIQSGRMEKTAVFPLATVHAAVNGFVNPESFDVMINSITILVTTVATAAAKIDVGVSSVSISTASDNLADGLDVHSGTAPLVVAPNAQAGTNGKFQQYWTAGTWLTVSDDATGDCTGFVGSVYVSYVPV